MTRLVTEPDPTYIRSLIEQLHQHPACGGQGPGRRDHSQRAADYAMLVLGSPILDRPGWTGSWEILRIGLQHQALFKVAPSITIPALTYFQIATSSLRARATIIGFFRRPPLFLTRSLNQAVSAEPGW